MQKNQHKKDEISILTVWTMNNHNMV